MTFHDDETGKIVQKSHAQFWVSGSLQDFFTYDPGPTPYGVYVYRENYHPQTIMVFARDEAHVREILQAMCDFEDDCHARYVANESHSPYRVGRTALLRELLADGTLDIQPIDTRQVLTLNPYEQL